MSSIIPVDTKTSIDPYTGQIFDFDTASSNVYLARTINENLIAYGDNCVLNGLTISNTSYDNITELFTFTLNRGKMIVDLTLIENLSDEIITVNMSNYVDGQDIYIFAEFKYLEVPFEVPLTILTYFQQSGVLYPQNSFDINKPKILIGVFRITKSTETVQMLTTDITVTDNFGTADYEYRPISDLVKSSIFHLNDKLEGLCLTV